MALTVEQLQNLHRRLSADSKNESTKRLPLGNLIDMINEPKVWESYKAATHKVVRDPSLEREAKDMTAWCARELGDRLVKVETPKNGQSAFAVVDMVELGVQAAVPGVTSKGKT